MTSRTWIRGGLAGRVLVSESPEHVGYMTLPAEETSEQLAQSSERPLCWPVVGGTKRNILFTQTRPQEICPRVVALHERVKTTAFFLTVL